ncbi:MAG TPA: monovalent cation/H(+) antiporter subunit G [Stellaceae bacterium]|jgi:multisubunit Na+/H+ antiporter MnhG subunit|nr:monovalent cation/H(+) antiporter subunit G [Stellaceae bacterium]
MAVRGAATGVFLALAVLSAWIASWGFLRSGTVLAKLHWVAFVNAVTGGAVTLAVWLQDGVSDRALKTLAIYAALVVAGSATTHAAARAIVLRSGRTR